MVNILKLAHRHGSINVMNANTSLRCRPPGVLWKKGTEPAPGARVIILRDYIFMNPKLARPVADKYVQ